MSRSRITPSVLTAVAVGGAVGSAARYGLTVLWPTPPGAFPWATLAANLLGSALLGALMQLITVRTIPHRLLTPFLGTGVLGGYTTFSAYALEVWELFATGHSAPAVAYLLTTLVGGLAAVRLGAWAVPAAWAATLGRS
ncbi:MAG TPA: fluoride efflux transporter CrcB [Micromonosporaceae bacterium]|nr:fluoride efflux transporter CrcB [Micromonosporaceae bacterium]